jgi:hypothetical protein
MRRGAPRGQSGALTEVDEPHGLGDLVLANESRQAHGLEWAKGQHPAEWMDATPAAFRCTIAASCPAALHSPARKSYAIIGSTIEHQEVPELAPRVASYETAVEISEELLNKAVVTTVLQQAAFSFLLIMLGQLLLNLAGRPIKFILDLLVRSTLAILLRSFNAFR